MLKGLRDERDVGLFYNGLALSDETRMRRRGGMLEVLMRSWQSAKVYCY